MTRSLVLAGLTLALVGALMTGPGAALVLIAVLAVICGFALWALLAGGDPLPGYAHHEPEREPLAARKLAFFNALSRGEYEAAKALAETEDEWWMAEWDRLRKEDLWVS